MIDSVTYSLFSLFILEQKYEIDKKQANLASFGFRKRTLHRAETVEVSIAKFATTDLETYEYTSCPKKSKNSQGLSVHLKSIHSDIEQDKLGENIIFLINKTSKEISRKHRER